MLVLKKFVPIYRMDQFIDIGLIKTASFLRLKYNKTNLDIIKQILYSGINMKDVENNSIYKEFYEKGLLTKYEKYFTDKKTVRNNLFMDFLNIKDFNKTKIFEKKILIFGAGAAGGLIAYLLTQFGYKNITIIDDDIIEISDVYKTVIYKKKDVGKFKVLALKKYIKENFQIDVQTGIMSPQKRGEINKVVETEKASLIIKACDPNLSFRYFLNDICSKNGIPFIYTSYSFDRINIGPFFVPKLTKSDRELDLNFNKTYGKEYSFLNYEKLFSDYTIHPSVSFTINILGNIVLKEIIFFHLKKYEYVFSLNKEVFFFPLTMKVYYRDLDKLSANFI